jgi:uncharacterized surface protein with fasciclin (FAS1) repeats
MSRFTLASAALALAVAFSPTAARAGSDIVDTAVAAGGFTTLAKALQAADLVGTLKGPGPFTVFAPSDAAFAKLPAGTLENLLKPENKDQLRAVLTYHVLPGKVVSGDLAGKKTEAKTVEGASVAVDATGSSVMVNDATVKKADIAASNGVIHAIDTVLLPPKS